MESQVRRLAQSWSDMLSDCFIPCPLHQVEVSGRHFTLEETWLRRALSENGWSVPFKLNALLDAKRGRPFRGSRAYWVIGTVACLLDENVSGGYVTRTVGLPVAVDLASRAELVQRADNEIARCSFIEKTYSLPREHEDHPFNNRFYLDEKTEAHAQSK